MKSKMLFLYSAAICSLFVIADPAGAQGPAFTYQGRLEVSGAPASGNYDFRFRLAFDPLGNTYVGNTALLTNDVLVTNGLFTVALNFGAGIFSGSNYWLEVDVRTNGSGNYTTLNPLQPLTPAPYSIYAPSAGVAAAVLPASVTGPDIVPGVILAGHIACGQVVKSLNGLEDAVTLAAGANLSITPNGNVLTLAATCCNNGWLLGGNGGTTAGTDFLGTTDNTALDMKVNGLLALRLEPAGGSPNVIGGGPNNSVAGAVSAFIGGGSGNIIQTNGYGSVIGGGTNNLINSFYSFIGGGNSNIIAADPFLLSSPPFDSCIGGGNSNIIQGSCFESLIGGGENNEINDEGEGASWDVTIGGGSSNLISGGFKMFATICGGRQNQIGGDWGDGTTLAGGEQNGTVYAYDSFIGGGYGNFIDSADDSSIGGGSGNRVGNYFLEYELYIDGATVAGGANNFVGQGSGTIGGGRDNKVTFGLSERNAGGPAGTIGGGQSNQVTGGYGTIPGGLNNVATNYSFAAGQQAQATNQGAFVWADSQNAPFASTTNDQVSFRCQGGARFFSNPGATVGVQLLPSANAWSSVSDRNAKKNFRPVDTRAVLEELAAIPVQRWNYKWESDGEVPHLGPMAQDFKSAFFPGRDDQSISTMEFDGVELAAIQGLNRKVEEQNAQLQRQVSAQAQELKAKDTAIQSLEERLARLEKSLGGSPSQR